MTGVLHWLQISLFPLCSPQSPPAPVPAPAPAPAPLFKAINNGNWTEWRAICAVIIHVISKSIERAARVQFENTSMISDQNCTTRGSITTSLHSFWNRPNAWLGQFKYFIDAVLSRFEIKLIHFLGGKSKNFGNKSSKICHTILFVYHFPAIWLVT